MWKLFRAVCSWLPLLKEDSDHTNRSDVVRCDCGCAWQDFWLGCAAHCSWNWGGNHLAVDEIFWFSGKLCILVQWYLDVDLEDLDQPAREWASTENVVWHLVDSMLLLECSVCWLRSLLTLRVATSWEPDYQSIAESPEKVTTLTNLSLCTDLMFDVSGVSWTPRSTYSLWVSSWIYWDLSFPELPCMELLLVTPGRATHFAESCPKSVLDVLLNCQGWILQKPMEVQLQIRLCCFLFFCIVQGLLFLERFFFLAVPKPLWAVPVALLISS